jgi:SAM-dependent methyltransferase
MPDLVDVYRRQARSGGPEHWAGPPQMVERIARSLGTDRGHLVVDVGCGVGGPARRLAELVRCRVIGVDIVREVVRSAARRRSPGVSYVAASATALPIHAHVVDQVWALGVVAHVVGMEEMAAELARVLRPGGRVALTEAFWEGRGAPRFAETAPRPWRPVTVSGLMSVFESAGFDDIRALPWPGSGLAGAYDPTDMELRRDLRDGRLVPGLVIGTLPEPASKELHRTGSRPRMPR